MANKHEIELDAICSSKNGKRLTPYQGDRAKITFRCQQQHEWATTPSVIKRGSWCPICADKCRDPAYHEAQLDEICQSKGGKRLSAYSTSTTNVRFQCAKGHEWGAVSSNIKAGQWCPACVGHCHDSTYHEAQLDEICQSKGGKRLSAYSAATTKVRLQCAKGHEWDVAPSSIKRGLWCPTCAGRSTDPVYHEAQLDEICNAKHGKRLSAYRGATTKVRLQCAKSHEWDATPHNIKNGRWCPTCAGKCRDYTYHEAQLDEICQSRCGKRLSAYRADTTKMRFQCAENHEWDTTPSSIKDGTWCPTCAGQIIVPTYYEEQLDEICKAKHGKRLSAYITRDTKMRFQCAENHEWDTTPSSIKSGTWCPTCSGVSRDLAYHEAQLDEICQSNGGKRLSAYSATTTKVRFQCAENHEWDVVPYCIKNGQWCPTCAGHSTDPAYHEVQLDEICQSKHGKRLSSYATARTKMRFQCAENHEWDTTPLNIKAGHWCPYCAGQITDPAYHEAQLDEICQSKGGKRLSAYSTCDTKVRFQCAKNHEWDTTPSSIKAGTWCPYCPNKSEATCREILETALGAKFPKERPSFLMYKNGMPLELDGYCRELNIAMEYDGEQHYFYIPFFHKDESDINTQQERDQFKLDKLIELKIDFISISYMCDTDDKKRNFIMYRLAQIFKKRGMSADEIVARFGDNDYDTIQRDYPTLTW